MVHEVISLKDYFPFLGENGCDPQLSTYLLDITPEMSATEQMRPALLILPGGGYYFVSSREGEPVALHFMAKGYRVFVLRYSVYPHAFPIAIREVAAAMELIHQNAEAWCVDVNRIAIMGFSAGGHLAGHYSNCYDCKEVRALFPESKPVKAAVLSYPVITADPRWHHLKSFLHLSGKKELTEDTIENLSLDRLVSEKTPPTFLWHTREDKIVPVMNSLLYAQALTEHNIPFALHIYPAGPHGTSTNDCLTRADIPENQARLHFWMEEAEHWLVNTL